MNKVNKPKGYEEYLSDYGEMIFDGWCGKCIGWGFKLIAHLAEDKFEKLRAMYELECIYPSWFLVMKWLSKKEAEKKYGKITNIERGPRGGFKSVTFGKTRFISKRCFRNALQNK